MAITINGTSNTITGLAVGGLPDGTVDGDTLAAGVPAITTTTGTNSFTVADGDLVIGTAGHGISFAATSDLAGMTGEILDDYETGSWTPTMTQGYTSITYVDQKGRYLKVGHLVYAQFRLGLSAGTTQGSSYGIAIGPLPFTPSNWTGEQPAGGMLIHSSIDSFQTTDADHWPYITGGDASSFGFQKSDGSGTTRAGANITSNKFIQGQILYSTGLS